MLSVFYNFVKINPKFYFHLSESQRSMWINIKHTPTIILSKGNTKNKKKEKERVERSIAQGFPSVSLVKNPPASIGDAGSIPHLGRSNMPWSS